MDRVFEPARAGRCADTLLVLLPGAYDAPGDFVRAGFVRAVRARRLPVDLLLLDAHTDYYLGQQIVERLRDEVVLPARAQGYARIWLVGISLGGYGATLFASRHGALVDGVFAVAAFLGRRDLPAAVGRAGGLLHWDGELAGADALDLALWRWLRRHLTDPDRPTPQFWLGYGEDDRFIASNRLLAAALPPGRVLATSGGHEWGPWLQLWERFLAARPWAAAASASR